ncbi:hypothetical protein MEQU1_002800 [Malassezia equina]|uniref:SP-RING-type domain-containing protein n=1 Tax=Malassezia equina TaxID=1381935 RepID=A0AAF0EEH3_9BASI|nr:hypothetical protein MEQU1_002800 [Malassezia equina]
MSHAIDAAHAPRVRQQLAQHRKMLQHIESMLQRMPEIGAELAEHPSEQAQVDTLDTLTRALLDVRQHTQARESALQHVQSQIAEGRAGREVPQTYEQDVQARCDAYKARTTRQKYAKDAAYMEFRARIWEVTGDGAMPPLTDMIPAEPGDEADDEDLVVGGTVQQFRCPLTALLLDDPVISSACGHAYSRAAIHTYLQERRQETRHVPCPAAGCPERVAMHLLRGAPELARRVERYQRQLARREAQRREAQVAAVLE